MPSGCVHGSNCQYAHVRQMLPRTHHRRRMTRMGKAKAKAKSDPKSSPPKALAAVAILAASVLGANGFEFAADTGAGRHLISREALINQGADGLDFDRNTRVAENPWDFTLVVVLGIHQTLLDLEMTFLGLPIISFWIVVLLSDQLVLMFNRMVSVLCGCLANYHSTSKILRIVRLKLLIQTRSMHQGSLRMSLSSNQTSNSFRVLLLSLEKREIMLKKLCMDRIHQEQRK